MLILINGIGNKISHSISYSAFIDTDRYLFLLDGEIEKYCHFLNNITSKYNELQLTLLGSKRFRY